MGKMADNLLSNFITIFVVFLVLNSISCHKDGVRNKTALVPAMFIFGDSLIDNGNNNNLPSFAKANYFPYGIDFDGGATGRFTNGYTVVDIVGELLGLPLLPPYTGTSPGDMRYGVNFASAAGGILDASGGNFVSRIPFNQQIKNFEDTLDQITDNLDGSNATLSKCIFYIAMGSNDYLNNYLMPDYVTRFQYNPQQYADLLTQQYSQQLTALYNLGARKFVIAGLGILGCIPSILSQGSSGNCSEDVNQLVLPFNANTKAMVNSLGTNLTDARFSYIDIYNIFQDLLANAGSYGFDVIDTGCCGVGKNRGQMTCLPLELPCTDRSRYLFWDAFHPTETANVLFGKSAFNGNKDAAYPMNIKQLANL